MKVDRERTHCQDTPFFVFHSNTTQPSFSDGTQRHALSCRSERIDGRSDGRSWVRLLLRGMKYLLFLFPRSDKQAKRVIDFRH